jgi:hypothetical protein
MPPRPHASMPPCPRASLLFALCTLPFFLTAQYFSLGNDPASVKWNQIKTEHFRIIYPNTMDSTALYLANAMEYIRIPVSASLDVTPDKWPVILHNQTVISNGMTPYAPKRIEMISVPPQDNEDTYGQDWLDQLAIHEFRHASQYTAINRGFTKGLSFLFGQQAVAGVFGVFVPFWFIEGDAVVTETALSNTGRGRVPAYEMKLRAQFLEKGIYSYDKAYNGSYRDFTADWYELGYLLVGHARLEYGKEAWSRVIRKTGNLPVMLVPFSNTLYKETGFGKSRLYKHITARLEQEWKATDQDINLSLFEKVNGTEDKYYTNRTRPAILSDGRIVSRKTSTDDIPRIMLTDTAGKESILITPGYMVDENLSASGTLICWAEAEKDPRWDLRTYSVIMVHDLGSGKTRQISNKTRYFSPRLSPDGKSIVAVEVDEQNNYFLVILDSDHGAVINIFPVTGNYFPDHPVWSPGGEQIAVVLTRDEGKCLAVADPVTGGFEIVMPFSNTEISKPCYYKHYILLTGSFTGIDNIFAFNTENRKLYQVTSARFGAADAAVSTDESRLYYSNYGAGGYELVSASLEPGTWKEWDTADNYQFNLAQGLTEQENFIFNQEDVPDSSYTIKRYRKGLNLFNPHSWAPLSIDVDNTDAKPGVSLLSQNLLGTSNTTLGYEYDLNEETGKYYLKYSYTGLYPAFDLDMDYGLRRGNINDSTHGQINYHYDEMNLGGWVRVPLNWNAGSWFVGLQPYLGYSYKLLTMNPGQEVSFTKDRYNSLNSAFYFYAQSRMSERDLNPKWLQRLVVNYRQTLFEGDSISSIFSTELDLYFPGFTRHHNFITYAGYQKRLIDEYNYTYSDRIRVPRGYSGINSNDMFSGSVAYEFPVFCPDWNIGPLVYFKRLNAAIFYDYAVTFNNNINQEFYSAGLDLTVDIHIFRLFAPFNIGLRTIYLPQSGEFMFEPVYRLNLSY